MLLGTCGPALAGCSADTVEGKQTEAPGQIRTTSDETRTRWGSERIIVSAPRSDLCFIVSHIAVTSTAAWADACSSAFVPLRVRSASDRFSANLTQHALSAEVTVTRVTSGASEVYRSDRVIAEHPRDDLIVSLHRAGTGTVTQHDRRARLRAGSAAMYDAASPYTLSFPTPISETVLQLPRRAIRPHSTTLADLTARRLPEGAPLRALIALAETVDPGSAAPTRLGSTHIADAMISLLMAIASAEEAAPLDAPLLAVTVQRFIGDNLADPTLCPESVAAAHHISLRLLQKLFAAENDSPAAYIRRRRLKSARRLLLEGAPVGRAAHLSGFRDPDTFGRAFKREFGTAPSAMKGANTASATPRATRGHSRHH